MADCLERLIWIVEVGQLQYGLGSAFAFLGHASQFVAFGRLPYSLHLAVRCGVSQSLSCRTCKSHVTSEVCALGNLPNKVGNAIRTRAVS